MNSKFMVLFLTFALILTNSTVIRWNNRAHDTIARSVRLQITNTDNQVISVRYLQDQTRDVFEANIDDLPAGEYFYRFSINDAPWIIDQSAHHIEMSNGNNYNQIFISDDNQDSRDDDVAHADGFEFDDITNLLHEDEDEYKSCEEQDVQNNGGLFKKRISRRRRSTGWDTGSNYIRMGDLYDAPKPKTSVFRKTKRSLNHLINYMSPTRDESATSPICNLGHRRHRQNLPDYGNDAGASTGADSDDDAGVDSDAASVPPGRMDGAENSISVFATRLTIILVGLGEVANDMIETAFFGDENSTSRQVVPWMVLVFITVIMPIIACKKRWKEFNGFQYFVLLLLMSMSDLVSGVVENTAEALGANIDDIKGIFITLQLIVLTAAVLLPYMLKKRE